MKERNIRKVRTRQLSDESYEAKMIVAAIIELDRSGVDLEFLCTNAKQKNQLKLVPCPLFINLVIIRGDFQRLFPSQRRFNVS